MNVRTWGASGFAVAVGCTATLLAQGPQTLGDKTAEKVTVTGCIARNAAPTASPAAATTSTGTPGQATGFLLTKAAVVPAPGGTPVAKPATAGKTAAPTQYQLQGSDSMLAPYVSRQVQITGTVKQGAAPAKRAAGSTGGSTLTVDTVEMIGGTCP